MPQRYSPGGRTLQYGQIFTVANVNKAMVQRCCALHCFD